MLFLNNNYRTNDNLIFIYNNKLLLLCIYLLILNVNCEYCHICFLYYSDNDYIKNVLIMIICN
jgi:hypothetical protein